jgi:hypothetical protein
MSEILSCNVCNKPAIGVASSSFGPVSWAYCAECARKPAEPESMFRYLYEDVSDRGEGLRPEVDSYFTFIDGSYVSWPDYVTRRNAQPINVQVEPRS